MEKDLAEKKLTPSAFVLAGRVPMAASARSGSATNLFALQALLAIVGTLENVPGEMDRR
ncbi:MAG: hypothetical protein ACRD4M_08680 [Candidatus Acidiferrales bacterium]